MKIFVFEYVTAGAPPDLSFPPSVTREADLMVRALVGDLLELPEVRVRCARDSRLLPIPGVDLLVPSGKESLEALFGRGVAWADAVWPTAPETGGVLAQLAAAVLHQGKALLGCRPAAVALAASKRATALALARTGIPVVPTFGPFDALVPYPGRWVVKPDDGAGCDGCRVVADMAEARAALSSGPGLVAQPWLTGEPASLSILVAATGATLLAVNRQRVELQQDRPALTGLEVNAIPDEGPLGALAAGVVAAIPGLWGYVGVDLILTAAGPVVLEVNPRLTTSYCGLGPALGVNVAGMALGRAPSGGTSRGSATVHSLDLLAPVDA